MKIRSQVQRLKTRFEPIFNTQVTASSGIIGDSTSKFKSLIQQQSGNTIEAGNTSSVGVIPTINSRGKLVFGNEIESEAEETDDGGGGSLQKKDSKL